MVAFPVEIVPVAGGSVLPGACSVGMELLGSVTALVVVVAEDDATDVAVDVDNAVVVFCELEGRGVAVRDLECKCVTLTVVLMGALVVVGIVGVTEKQTLATEKTDEVGLRVWVSTGP